MAFDVIASSYQQKERQRTPLSRVLIAGLTFGGVAIFSAMVGILNMFHERWIIDQIVTLGHAVILVFAMWGGWQVAAKTTSRGGALIALQGAGAGAVAGMILAVLPILMSVIKLRGVFIALTPALSKMLLFELSLLQGVVALVAAGAACGLAGALLFILPRRVRRPILIGLIWMAFIGLFQELIQLIIQDEWMDWIREPIFTWDGLRLQGAIGIVIVMGVVTALWDANRPALERRYEALPGQGQKFARLAGVFFILMFALVIFPFVAGNFIGQVLLFISLFILMGMGLNLEIGLAGLLDMGFVAFFAVGAYTCALLTADSPYALYQVIDWFPQFNFWWSMFFAVIAACIIGVLFGVPVLKIRGDYLAVATLGLGEIVRVLVLSDFAAPVLAGAQGILNIPPPEVALSIPLTEFAFEKPLDDPLELYYLALACAGVAAYFAWALENSRLGRAWTAIRDDEDVAQALGINLVNVKLMAYGLGAAFAGMAGAIFATMLTSIYPHSFQLLISVNVLALIIVGGMGSLPGVVVGAIALIGLPELLREFGEYRYLFYGIAIVVVMRVRPAGLWPSAAKRREMQLDEETRVAVEAELASDTPAQTQSGDFKNQPN